MDVRFTVSLSKDSAAHLKRFLDRVGYGDIYRHVEHEGDGNKLDSASDCEVRATREALRQVNSALSSAAKFPPQ